MMGNDSTYSSTKAAKGQAINLAVHEAVHLGKQDDTKFVLTRYLHYFNLSQMIQGLSLEEIEGEIQGLSLEEIEGEIQ